MEKLADIYYNPKTGFLSANKMFKKLTKLGINLKLQDVHDFLQNQHTFQVNKQVKKPKHFEPIIAPSYGNNYQIDLMIYDRYTFHNYKYILCCVDVYSRFAQARPLTNRGSSNILESLEDIFKVMGIPKNINCDNEFNNEVFNKYFERHGINTYFSQPNEINKNAIVERFNRTLALMIQKWRVATGKYEWYKVLNDLVDNYNETYHTTIKATPKDVKEGKDRNNQKVHVQKIDLDELQVGDRVRAMNKQVTFDKGDKPKFSKTIYHISRIVGHKFYLTNPDGVELKEYYKPYQLQKVNKVSIYQEKEEEQEKEHEQIQRTRREDRMLNKEGIERENILAPTDKRVRKKPERFGF